MKTPASLVLSVLCLATTGRAGPSAPPNIVVILADDQGYADVSYNPHSPPEVSTPNIDQLAQSGVICSQGYVSGHVCSPTRAGLMTGRYQQRAGIYTAGQGGSGMPLTERWIPMLTREAVAFIHREKDNPFFAYVAYNAVHAPAQAPAEDVKRYATGDETRDTLMAMLHHLDLGVGKIVQALTRLYHAWLAQMAEPVKGSKQWKPDPDNGKEKRFREETAERLPGATPLGHPSHPNRCGRQARPEGPTGLPRHSEI